MRKFFRKKKCWIDLLFVSMADMTNNREITIKYSWQTRVFLCQKSFEVVAKWIMIFNGDIAAIHSGNVDYDS